jgi:serine/threonine protein kinase
MAADRWKRIEELFGAAVALAPAERSGFLQAQCGDDADLLRRVEYLLKHDARANDSFLPERPDYVRLHGLLQGGQEVHIIGQGIGAFAIKSRIARGGMGTVYLAEQANPKREVALKVLHAGFWTASAEKRFEFESQILARLSHPNIAQVFEAGTALPSPCEGEEQGGVAPQVSSLRPQPYSVSYFAMEYVHNARTITQFANEHQLGIRERLDLILQVCDAVAYAHGKGVLHRDLKPGNILVGSEDAQIGAATVRERRAALPDGRGSDQPIVKIIDFGVARVVDTDVAMTTMHTETGQLIGTLAYMSPEQCDADPLGLDTRSDVYSLGVVLYELLCGRLPYDVSKTSIVAAAKTIKETPPARPSAITICGTGYQPVNCATGLQPVKGDLETILLKSLEKDRAKRYASVADFAADIRRYLNREPISARPPTVWTRTLRWAVRHPKSTTAVACAFIGCIILGTVAITSWYFAIRPDRIVLDDDQKAVRLLSKDNRELHNWNSGVGAGISFAWLVDRPAQFGGGKLVLLGFLASSNLHAGRLCAFELDGDWQEPKWQARVEPSDLPDDILDNLAARGFGVYSALGGDFFKRDSHPGEEIAVVFSHGRSRRLLRTYDLDGRPLYGFWQDGGVNHLYWMNAASLLVFGGASEKHKDVATSWVGDLAQAPVVFAVRPTSQDSPSRMYIADTLGTGGPATTQPTPAPSTTWHKYLHPPGIPGLRIHLSVNADVGDFAAGTHVGLEIRVFSKSTSVGAVQLVLDEHGKEVSKARRPDDAWTMNKERYQLPDPSVFELRDDPPPLLPTTQSSS